MAPVDRSAVPERGGLLVATTVATLSVVAVCAGLFAVLANEVRTPDRVTTFDQDALSWVVDRRTQTLTAVARAVTHLGDPWLVVSITTLVTLGLVVARRFSLGVFMVMATSGAAIISSVSKQVVDRARPPEALWLMRAWGPSFPSGHATQSVACYTALAIIACVLLRSTRRRGAVVAAAVAVGLLIGLSRIYLGVHWVSDVVAGWSVGGGWLAVLVLLGWCVPRLRSPRRPRPPDPRPV